MAVSVRCCYCNNGASCIENNIKYWCIFVVISVHFGVKHWTFVNSRSTETVLHNISFMYAPFRITNPLHISKHARHTVARKHCYIEKSFHYCICRRAQYFPSEQIACIVGDMYNTERPTWSRGFRCYRYSHITYPAKHLKRFRQSPCGMVMKDICMVVWYQPSISTLFRVIS